MCAKVRQPFWKCDVMMTTANRPDAKAEMERMVRKNRRITTDQEAGDLKISNDSACVMGMGEVHAV